MQADTHDVVVGRNLGVNNHRALIVLGALVEKDDALGLARVADDELA